MKSFIFIASLGALLSVNIVYPMKRTLSESSINMQDLYIYKCIHPGCNRSFAMESSLEEHKRIHHAIKIKNNTTLIIPNPKSIKHSQEIFDSEKSDTEVESSLESKDDADMPILTTVMPLAAIVVTKKFECTFDGCNKAFAYNSYLIRHMRTHTGEKPYSCTVCDKSFKLAGHLTQHKRIHTGEKSYSCTICDKSFAYKNVLNDHMRTHTGEKPYTCTVCNKSFSQSHSLNVHMRTHTEKNIIPVQDVTSNVH